MKRRRTAGARRAPGIISLALAAGMAGPAAALPTWALPAWALPGDAAPGMAGADTRRAVAPNLVSNPSVELAGRPDTTAPLGWARGGWGTNTRTLTYPVPGRTGSKALRTTISRYTDGDAKWAFSPVAVTPGTGYAFSDWYRANAPTRVVLESTDTRGAVTYTVLGTLPAAATWTPTRFAFVTSATTARASVLHVLATTGWLDTDDAGLSLTGTTTLPNLIANGSAESGTGTPSGWTASSWGTNTPSFTWATTGYVGSRSLRVELTGHTDGDAKWAFTPVALTPGADYRLAFALTGSVEPRVYAAHRLSDGTTRYDALTRPMGVTPARWTPYATPLSVPTNAVSTTVYVLLDRVGWIQTDDYSLTAYAPASLATPLVSVTFDDGLLGTYTNGLPVLRRYGLPSTQYLISGLLNTPGYMSTAQALEFVGAGSEVGSHTVSHPDLTLLARSALTTELTGSQAALRAAYGASAATALASPYGSYDSTTLAAIRTTYGSHRTVDAGFNTREGFDGYTIRVQDVDAATPVSVVTAWIDKAKAQRCWLVLVYHDVLPAPGTSDAYAVSTATLDAELAYLKASGVEVRTVSDALALVRQQLP